MKKYFMFIMSLLVTIATATTLFSCDSDDDEFQTGDDSGDSHLACPDNNHPHLIDLGLPSGTKWVCCNVGASTPVENGGYYAWGELEEKNYYEANTYVYGDPKKESSFIGTNIAGTKYDVAYVKSGHEYEMPTITQFREVQKYCSLEWVTLDGKNGCMVTGPSGNSIFLPATGIFFGKNKIDEDINGHYWTSAIYDSGNYAYDQNCTLWGWYLSTTSRAAGQSVRGVGFSESHADPKPNPDKHIAEAIDLGLPSGTKWASWNIGAAAPEEYGNNYAWGETEEKDVYSWSTYTHCDGSRKTCHHIGDDIAGTEFDVAHVKWGGSWRMPSLDQYKELIEKCTRKWTTQNGVKGTLVTGPNGNAIFLPAAGHCWDGYLSDVGEYGSYWSSSLNFYYEDYAYYLRFDSDDWYWSGSSRGEVGYSVRAVCP